MIGVVLVAVWTPIIAYLSFAVFYQIFLAVAYFVKADKSADPTRNHRYKYLLLVPAHNEETLIGRLLESIRNIDYDKDDFKVAVVVDNCIDSTADIASEHNARVLVRKDDSRRGKGFAIAWALRQINLDEFDAIVVIDADNIVDSLFFHGLNKIVAKGSNAIQCYNALANPDETAFTRIIHLSRTINNSLYHEAKYMLGLSSWLMGNGMCLTTKLLKQHGWTTTTMAEDLEYYAKLIKGNEIISFAAGSKLYHQESRGIRQATDQRLRWSSGKLQIARKHGCDILRQGLRERNLKKMDAALPLILPNLSLMANLIVIALLMALAMNLFYSNTVIVGWLLFLLLLETLYFLSGIYLTRMPIGKVLYSIGFIPVFLVWKGCIDVKSAFGKKMTHWGKSKR
jgi:cellulose synthase/poly-beta-1,6-N-acetylglucosamine synthase-like glycosyltransferase